MHALLGAYLRVRRSVRVPKAVTKDLRGSLNKTSGETTVSLALPV